MLPAQLPMYDASLLFVIMPAARPPIVIGGVHHLNVSLMCHCQLCHVAPYTYKLLVVFEKYFVGHLCCDYITRGHSIANVPQHCL